MSFEDLQKALLEKAKTFQEVFQEDYLNPEVYKDTKKKWVSVDNVKRLLAEVFREKVLVDRKQLSDITDYMILGRPAVFAEETDFDKGYAKGYYDAKGQVKERIKELLEVSDVEKTHFLTVAEAREKLKMVSGKETSQ